MMNSFSFFPCMVDLYPQSNVAFSWCSEKSNTSFKKSLPKIFPVVLASLYWRRSLNLFVGLWWNSIDISSVFLLFFIYSDLKPIIWAFAIVSIFFPLLVSKFYWLKKQSGL